jgi:Prp8 binding protein
VLWPTPTGIISCSADKTVACWDANKGTRVRKLVEHTAIVNAVAVARDMPHFIASGSDDCTVILWDNRQKQSVGSMYHDYQVLSVAMSADGQTIYSAGIDNVIRRFDVRNFEQPDLTLEGHGDSITGLSLSPDEKHLLSNAMDGTLRSWDVRPFAEGHSRVREGR